ncbi:MAG: stage II sporulation protein R [Solirubrobacterales bacterium]
MKQKSQPYLVGIILIGLMLGLHIYQEAMNPCYRVLRLHIIANSDRIDDQLVKLMVRDAILKQLNRDFAAAHNGREAEAIARKQLPALTRTAAAVLRREGKNDRVKAMVGAYAFPTRFYEHAVFPAGRYTAVRIVLGRGEGRNWWCVLYPPMCLEAARGGQPAPGSGTQLRLKVVEMIRFQTKWAENRK